MKYINKEQICSVKVQLELLHHDYEWHNEKRFLGFVIKKEGFRHYFDGYISAYNGVFDENRILEMSKNVIILHHKVFYKPHLDIKTSDKETHTIFFEKASFLHNFIEIHNIHKFILAP